MNKANPTEMITALEREFPSVPEVSWLDLPAVLYAIAVAEDGDLDLDADVIEPDGSHSIGPWQVNQKQHHSAAHPDEDIGPAPLPGSSLADHIAYIGHGNPRGVSLVKELVIVPLTEANRALEARVRSGERQIKFNAIFDAPLWASISWQYGPSRLLAWAKTPGAHMGEIGFKKWFAAQKFVQTHGPNAGGPAVVEPGYDRRQATVRAAYVTAIGLESDGWRKTFDGLVESTKKSGIDYITSAIDGYPRLAQIVGIKPLIAAARTIGREVASLDALAVTNAELGKLHDAMKRSIQAFEDTVEPASGGSLIGLLVPAAALGVGIYLITRPSRRRRIA